MKPTVQAPDFYKIGNDYAQGPLSSFFDTSVLSEAEVEKKALAMLGYKAVPTQVTDETKPGYDKWMTWSALTAQLAETPANYQDGIFTKLADALSGEKGAYSADYFKNPEGFNKRRVFVGADATGKDSQLDAGAIYSMDAFGEMDEDLRELQPAVKDEQYSKADIVVPDQYEEPAKQTTP